MTEPFGKEWKDEMMKMKKTELIEFIRPILKKMHQITAKFAILGLYDSQNSTYCTCERCTSIKSYYDESEDST